MEDIRQGAPAVVAGEHGFLGLRRLTAFVFDESERADGREIVAGLFFQPALTDSVGLDYPEVPRRRLRFIRR
jgi:hypothetical protein